MEDFDNKGSSGGSLTGFPPYWCVHHNGDVTDRFKSSVIPYFREKYGYKLERLHYCFYGETPLGMHLHDSSLGIILSLDQFDNYYRSYRNGVYTASEEKDNLNRINGKLGSLQNELSNLSNTLQDYKRLESYMDSIGKGANNGVRNYGGAGINAINEIKTLRDRVKYLEEMQESLEDNERNALNRLNELKKKIKALISN